MSLIDFIFPQQAQAFHLSEIADASKDIRRHQTVKDAEENSNKFKISGIDRRITKLEGDVALLTMINALLIKKYIQDTGKSIDELQIEINKVDASDGEMNGGLDTDEFRKIIGLPIAKFGQVNDPKNCPDCGRVISINLNRCLYCGYMKV